MQGAPVLQPKEPLNKSSAAEQRIFYFASAV